MMSLCLNLLDAFRKLLPVVHDCVCLGLFGQQLSHLVLLLLALLNLVDADIGNDRNPSAHGRCGPGLAVLDRESLLRLYTELLASVKVDGGISASFKGQALRLA